MRYLVRFHGVALFAALLALIASAASAQAETDSVVVSPGQLEVAQRSELESRLADLETAYQEANVRKPRAGVAVSVLLIAGGVMAQVAGGLDWKTQGKLHRGYRCGYLSQPHMLTGGDSRVHCDRCYRSR